MKLNWQLIQGILMTIVTCTIVVGAAYITLDKFAERVNTYQAFCLNNTDGFYNVSDGTIQCVNNTLYMDLLNEVD